MAGLLALVAGPSASVEIVFDYSYDASGFFDDPERRAVLEAAADAYRACTDDDGLAPLPPREWIAFFRDPSGEEFVSLSGLEVPADTLLIFVGAQPSLAAGRLATGGPGHLRFPCRRLLGMDACMAVLWGGDELPWIRRWLLRHAFRGSAAARAYPPDDFAIWGGSLSFASDADWYFGERLPVPRDRFDFLTSALHELGHVLGIGTAESWGVRVPRHAFEGTEAVAAYGGAVPLAPDRAHWAKDTSSYARGVPQRAAFTTGQSPGERRLLTELDCAALRDVGWRRDLEGPPSNAIKSAYAGRRIKGDVNGDGVVSAQDAAYVRAALEGTEPSVDYVHGGIDWLMSAGGPRGPPASSVPAVDPLTLDDPLVFEAADVFPLVEGNAVGDGVVDERDLALLEDVADDVGWEDADGDGVASLEENLINWFLWMPTIGRPRHAPLTRWTDACLAEGVVGTLAWDFLVEEGAGISLEFCGRDGSPWSRSPALSPEEALGESVTGDADAPPADGVEPTPSKPRARADESARAPPEEEADRTEEQRPPSPWLPLVRVRNREARPPPRQPGAGRVLREASAAPASPRPLHGAGSLRAAPSPPGDATTERPEQAPSAVASAPGRPAPGAEAAAASLAEWFGSLLIHLWNAIERLLAWMGWA